MRAILGGPPAAGAGCDELGPIWCQAGYWPRGRAGLKPYSGLGPAAAISALSSRSEACGSPRLTSMRRRRWVMDSMSMLRQSTPAWAPSTWASSPAIEMTMSSGAPAPQGQLDEAGHANLRRMTVGQLQQHALERDVQHLAAQMLLGGDQLGARGEGNSGKLAAFVADDGLPLIGRTRAVGSSDPRRKVRVRHRCRTPCCCPRLAAGVRVRARARPMASSMNQAARR